MPSSKKLDKLSTIRANSSAFRILSFLAQQSEKHAEVIICEKDYQHSSRSFEIKADSSAALLESQAARAFAFGYNESTGRGGLNDGVQIEGRH